MDGRSTFEYFRMPESNKPAELIYGVVREPPSPGYGHQRVAGRVFVLLHAHVTARALGDVCIAPMDVVLDEQAALVVQPDVMFVSAERSSIIRNHIWGAPDLVVEVASASTEHRDKTIKLAWYRKYGVRECWLLHSARELVTVVQCSDGVSETFEGAQPIRSRVFPDLTATAEECFR